MVRVPNKDCIRGRLLAVADRMQQGSAKGRRRLVASSKLSRVATVLGDGDNGMARMPYGLTLWGGGVNSNNMVNLLP